MTTSAHKKIDVSGLKELIKTKLSQRPKDELVLGALAENDDAKKMCKQMMKDEENLKRILVARKYESGPSWQLFFEQARWRTEFKPTEVQPSSMKTALPSGTWRMCGYSKNGCPISNFKLALWDPDAYEGDLDTRVEEYTRYVCYMVELMIASMKSEKQFVVIFDLDGFSTMMVFNSSFRNMIVRLIYVAQSQYPERLRHAYAVNAPYGFSTAWALIKPLLDEKTSAKIDFPSAPKDMLEDIDAEVLAAEYGGNHDEYPIPSGTIAEEAAKVRQ